MQRPKQKRNRRSGHRGKSTKCVFLVRTTSFSRGVCSSEEASQHCNADIVQVQVVMLLAVPQNVSLTQFALRVCYLCSLVRNTPAGTSTFFFRLVDPRMRAPNDIYQARLLSLQRWGLIDLPPRASNEGSPRPRVARALKIIRLHFFFCSASRRTTRLPFPSPARN